MDVDFQAVLWRGLRGAVASGITAALALQPNWGELDQALRVVGIGFVSGFLLALGKFIRDQWGDKKADEGVVNKLPI